MEKAKHTNLEEAIFVWLNQKNSEGVAIMIVSLPRKQNILVPNCIYNCNSVLGNIFAPLTISG